MKSNPYEHLLNHDVLKGGLLASLIGLLPSIGTGAFTLSRISRTASISPPAAAWAKIESPR